VDGSGVDQQRAENSLFSEQVVGCLG